MTVNAHRIKKTETSTLHDKGEVFVYDEYDCLLCANVIFSAGQKCRTFRLVP